MNLDEARRLLSFISAVCPSQRIDAKTPEAWAVLLADQPYDDCYRAAQRVARREKYINVADIIAEVRTIKAGRIPAPGEWGACPEHVGQWLTSCGPCRSERIAKEPVHA